ncbi:hypothetical protein FHG87_001899, partial [Trinorchestia longiramus]
SHTDLRQDEETPYGVHNPADPRRPLNYRHSDFNQISDFQSTADQELRGAHLDLKDYQVSNSHSQHPSPSQYMSRTLPTPGPPQQLKRYVVKPPQHVDQ